MAFLLLSWSSAIVMQVERGQIGADLSGGLLGYGVKLGYPFYSFGLGETLFPWTWLALAGLLLVLALWVLGAIFWLKRAEGLTLALLLSLPLGFTILILSSVATDITFLNVPSRTFFALPYYMLILAGGWWQVRSPHIRLLLLIALAVVWGHGLINLHTGREYHNPIYAVPTREVVAWIRAEARPGDVVLSDPDTGFDYYYERGPQPVPGLSTSDTKAALAYLEERHPSRVWLLTFGRDRTRESEPVDLMRWLAERYRVGMEQGYVEQDPTYRRVKERLLHRPAYQYKLVVRRYEGQVP
jgi:hypothetical protein